MAAIAFNRKGLVYRIEGVTDPTKVSAAVDAAENCARDNLKEWEQLLGGPLHRESLHRESRGLLFEFLLIDVNFRV